MKIWIALIALTLVGQVFASNTQDLVGGILTNARTGGTLKLSCRCRAEKKCANASLLLTTTDGTTNVTSNIDLTGFDVKKAVENHYWEYNHTFNDYRRELFLGTVFGWDLPILVHAYWLIPLSLPLGMIFDVVRLPFSTIKNIAEEMKEYSEHRKGIRGRTPSERFDLFQSCSMPEVYNNLPAILSCQDRVGQSVRKLLNQRFASNYTERHEQPDDYYYETTSREGADALNTCATNAVLIVAPALRQDNFKLVCWPV